MGAQLHRVLELVLGDPKGGLVVRPRLYTRLCYLVQFSNLLLKVCRCVITGRRLWDCRGAI